MNRKNLMTIFSLLVLVSLLLAGCASPTEAPVEPEEPAAEEPVAEEPAAEEPAEPEVMEPTGVNIAVVFLTPIEEPWNLLMVSALDQLVDEKPHGLTITWEYTDNVWFTDADRVIREYADSGDYDIIIAHSTYADVVDPLSKEYPDIAFSVSGSGNFPIGGNAYYFHTTLHEPTYLMGIIAGLMTESNKIGMVTAFPNDIESPMAHAFYAGAQSVNPDVSMNVTYIESFYDPPKAADAATALINAGADHLLAGSFGTFDACKEAEIICYGVFEDQFELAPEVVATSATMSWYPHAVLIVEEWWKFAAEGTAYDAPMEKIWFPMAEGGSGLAPYHDWEDVLPDDVKQAVADAMSQIMDGTLVVELNEAAFGSE